MAVAGAIVSSPSVRKIGEMKFRETLTPSGTTANRAGLGSGDSGYVYFDTSLGFPIWWDGSDWVSPLIGAVCNNDQVICLNNEIIYKV